MGIEPFKEIAKEIINNEIYMNWKFYLILISLIVLGNIFNSFLISYSKKRGELLATKADLDEILLQQKRITETTEQIKNEIEHSLWEKKEYKTLRRQKLEQLLTLIYEQEKWLDLEKNHHLFNDKENIQSEMSNQIKMLNKLYFPELNEPLNVFFGANFSYTEWILDGRREVIEKKCKGEQNPTLSQEHLYKFKEVFQTFSKSKMLIEVQCSELMGKIFNT